MLFSRKKADLPGPREALPGRAAPIPTAATHFVNRRALKGPYPPGIETAIFGLGCFWGAERIFWRLGPGIHVTAVGYAGGTTPNATYEETCSGLTGHTEAVLVAAVVPGGDGPLPGEAHLCPWRGHDHVRHRT